MSAFARVTRRFNVPPEMVFNAWLDPKAIGQWMFGPKLRGEEIIHIEIDPRVDGRFSFLVRRQGDEIDHVGRYLELDPPKRLVFTWGAGGQDSERSRVSIDVVPLEQGCELRLTHELDPDWDNFVDQAEAAWTRMIGALSETLGQARTGRRDPSMR